MIKNLEQFSDQALITQFKDGDSNAITALIYRYQSNVYSTIYYFHLHGPQQVHQYYLRIIAFI